MLLNGVDMSEEKVELLPCPFCGGHADYFIADGIFRYKVKCGNCGATSGGSAFRNDDYNAKKWNIRDKFV